MRSHWERLVADADRRAEAFLATQIREAASGAAGSVPTAWGIPDPKPTMFQAANAMACYLCPDSRLHLDPRVPEAYRLALGFTERSMNEDGSFDYPYCNFRSAPDTAFIINRIFVTRGLLARGPAAQSDRSRAGAPGAAASGAAASGTAADPALEGLLGRVDALLERAGRGIMAGGFHTPNHRWACAAALSSCHRLTGDPAFKAAAERYLLEGIDNSADGEYAERSSGGYNIVNNEQMLILAGTRGDPSFLDYVEKNLEMMFAYMDPDGSIFTENSTRQDKGTRTFPEGYWFHYLYMARERKRPDFAAMARDIMELLAARNLPPADVLDQVMLCLGGIDYGEAGTVPASIRRLFRESGVARIRRESWSCSLLRGNPYFLHFQAGSVRASLRLGVGFFERRDFLAESLEEEGESLVLRLLARGWYYLPWKEKPATSDWWAMDNKAREKIWGPDLRFELRVTERPEGDGVDLGIKAEGWDEVPLRLEIGLTTGGELESEGFCLEARAGGAIIAKSGSLVLRDGLDALGIGPAFARHRNMSGTYGSQGRSSELFTAYFTDLTPTDRVVSLRRLDPRRSAP